MGQHDESSTDWRAAAERAAFRPYRPVDPAPDRAWMGGFGRTAEATTHLGIDAVIDGDDIEIDTTAVDDRSDANLDLRDRMHRAVFHHLLADNAGPVDLPFELRILAEDREITVDGVAHTFTGLRVEGGQRWFGTCVVGSTRIRVTTTGHSHVDAIEATNPSDIDDYPVNKSHG